MSRLYYKFLGKLFTFKIEIPDSVNLESKSTENVKAIDVIPATAKVVHRALTAHGRAHNKTGETILLLFFFFCPSDFTDGAVHLNRSGY